MGNRACPAYEALIVRAADGQLDESGRASLEAHLPGCAGCREALAAQRAMRAALTALPRVNASAGFQARVMARLQPSPWIVRWDFRRWTWRLAPIAALMVLAVYGVARRTDADSPAAPVAETTSDATDTTGPGAPVLWSESMSDTSVLSLMLQGRSGGQR